MASLRFQPDTSLHCHAVTEYPVSLCLTVTLLFKPDTSPHRHTVTEYSPLICALRASLRLELDTSPGGHGATEYPRLALSYSHASVQARYVTAWPCCDSNYVPSLSSLMASFRFKPDTSLHGHQVTIIMSLPYPV